MKILVTGKTGQVGWRLARLLPAIAETIVAGRDTADLSNPDSLRNAIRAVHPDVIVNAAAYTDVDRAESEQELAHAVNAKAVGIMAEEAKRLRALLVHYSSDYVFDGTASRPYTERDVTHPISAYGRSKLAGDEAIVECGCDYLILRTSWVYDTRGRNFLLTILRLAAEREELRIVDDQTGTPTWAHAIAEATAAILRDGDRARQCAGIYNLCASDSTTRYDFTNRMLELSREVHPPSRRPRLIRIKTADYPLPARRPLNSALDNTKLAKIFGLRMPDWTEQLRQCLNELRAGALHS